MVALRVSWAEWTSDQTVREWVRELVADDGGLITLLRVFTQKSTKQTVGSRVASITWFIRLKNLEKFSDIEELRKRVEGISTANLPSTDARAIHAFKEALERRARGELEKD